MVDIKQNSLYNYFTMCQYVWRACVFRKKRLPNYLYKASVMCKSGLYRRRLSSARQTGTT